MIKYQPSFYDSIDFHINGIQVIVWPDIEAKDTYKDMTYGDIESYLKDILDKNSDFSKDSSYMVAFLWSFEGERMTDMWKFNSNHVDDRSGPLSDVKIFKEKKECSNLGLASGNTLLVLGEEEKLRRGKTTLEDYLKGNPPSLYKKLLVGKDFFS